MCCCLGRSYSVLNKTENVQTLLLPFRALRAMFYICHSHVLFEYVRIDLEGEASSTWNHVSALSISCEIDPAPDQLCYSIDVRSLSLNDYFARGTSSSSSRCGDQSDTTAREEDGIKEILQRRPW